MSERPESPTFKLGGVLTVAVAAWGWAPSYGPSSPA